MSLRARILRTVGFNLAALACILGPHKAAQAFTEHVLIPHHVVTPTYDFYQNFRPSP